MRFWLLFMFLVAAPCDVWAETVLVRSGEHGSFTRVVLEFETRPEWRAGRIDGGYLIAFHAAAGRTFDTGSAFRVIDRKRLADLVPSATGDGIELWLGCECWADIFEYRDAALVIDIRDGPSPDAARHEAPIGSRIAESGAGSGVGPTSGSAAPPPLQAAGPVVDQLDAGLPLTFERPLRTTGQLPAPAAPTMDPANFHRENTDPSRFSPQPFAGEALSGLLLEPSDSFAVDMLSKELSRAVAQGLVDVPDMRTVIARPRPALSEDTAASDPARSNLTVTTAIDRDIGSIRSRPAPTASGSICLPDSEVDIASWGDPTNPSLLGTFRSRIFEENGAVSPDGALVLVRYYLTMGFGAEARRIAEFVPDDRQRSILQTMAEIADHGESQSGVLAGQIFCDGKVALWAMLAEPVAVSDRPANTDHILSTFSELPLHIRIHLGPVLSERLRAIGFEGEAQMALNAVTRGGGYTPAQDLTAARLGLSGTTAETARAELARLARGTDLIAAEALLELLLDAERRGVTPERDWVADAPSLVRATQGTDTAAELNLAGMRGRIALGDFDTLREALDERSPGLTEDSRLSLATLAIAGAAEQADDAMFLRSELGFSKIADTTRIPREQRVMVADRLLSLGLDERALPYISASPTTDEERRVAASVYAGLQRHDEAIAALSGTEGNDLLADLGSVLLKSGRPAEAVEVFARAAQIEAASDAALRDGDWDWIRENAEEPLAKASEALRDDAEVATDRQSNAALLVRAETRREQARFLLDRTRLDENPQAFTN